MRYKIAICDDEMEELELLQNLVTRWNASCEIETYQSAEEFLFHYEDHKDYDLLLCLRAMGAL